MTLLDLLDNHPSAPSEALVHTVSGSRTRAEVVEESQTLAARLRELGVGPGHAVVVRLTNTPELVATMFAVWRLGAVFTSINPRATAAEVVAITDTVRPAAVIDSTGAVAVGDPTTYPDGTAFIMWTSGTTGLPKPVQHTHDGYLEFLDRVLGPLRSKPSDRRPTPNLIPVSMALNAGLYNVLFGLRAGAELVLMDRFEPVEFAALIARFEIRSTVLPPAAIAALNDDDRVVELAPLKYVRSITAPLSPLQARRFMAKFGVFVLNGYGQAEIGEVIGWTAADAKAHPDKIGAVGRPHPGVDVRIDDRGHLLVRPPNTAAGLDERVDGAGYVDTGDIARIDDDGFVWIEGRATDLINRGGNKIVPAAVEEVLRLSTAVDDVAVVGCPDDRLGEVPVAVLVGTPVPDAELDALCREHLTAYKVPVRFVWVDALPRNEIGKVLRAQLVQTLTTPNP